MSCYGRTIAASAIVILCGVAAKAAEVVPYQAPGWHYAQVPWNDPLATTFYSTSFDDSEWNVGQGAFGNFAELQAPPPFCAAVHNVHTQWDLDTDMLLRREFNASPSFPVTIYLSIDNDAVVYVNGVDVLTVEHESCPFQDDFSVVVPSSALSPTGSNLLAIRAHDRGWFSFVDARVFGEFPPLAVEASTWGAIKALYQ